MGTTTKIDVIADPRSGRDPCSPAPAPSDSREGVAAQRPTVSVCMPASRNIPWFQQALRSVLCQSLREIEVVITDDSGGDLREVVESFADSRIRYYPNPSRLGFAGNHCRAIELCLGASVAFLHDDDEWEPDYLALASEVLATHPEVGLVLCGAEEIDFQGNVIGPRPARMGPGLQPDALDRFLRPDFMMMLPSVTLFRRAALDVNKRPWPDVVSADLTMFLDAALAQWKVFYIEGPLVRYRIHDSQISSTDLALRHALVTVWSRYHFSEDRLERRRRKILAQCLIARAGAWLRRHNFDAAREDLTKARRLDAETSQLRWLVLRMATVVPFVLSPLLKLREWLPRKHRHAGT